MFETKSNNSSSLDKSKHFIHNFINVENENLKDKLINYFSGKKIYCEVYNGSDNLSHSFISKLEEYKANIYKTLSKNLDYIVFKDGHLKTKRFATFNNIKLVNPLWIDDKITNGIFEDDATYIIKVNYAEIALINFSKNKNELLKSEDEECDFSDIDEFEEKFSDYVDSKMKSNKTQKNSNYKIKNQLYFPIFDKKIYRQKRRSNMNYSYININSFTINNNSQILNNDNTESKKEKLLKNKSEKCLSKQTFIEIKDNKLTFTSNIKNKEYYTINQISDNIINPNNKIHIFTYCCTQSEISTLENMENFEYLGEMNDISKAFDKTKDILIINWEGNQYNYKIYKFLFDKILVVDLYNFLLEFINESFDLTINKEKNEVLKRLNSILLINNFRLLKYKIIKQKTPLDKNNMKFIINRNIIKEEYNILFSMLQKYLQADVYKNFEEDCKLLNSDITKEKNSKIKQKTGCFNSSENINSSKLYFVSKNKISNLNWLNQNKKYNLMISTNYIYDSFIKGSLIDLNEVLNIMKYEI